MIFRVTHAWFFISTRMFDCWLRSYSLPIYSAVYPSVILVKLHVMLSIPPSNMYTACRAFFLCGYIISSYWLHMISSIFLMIALLVRGQYHREITPYHTTNYEPCAYSRVVYFLNMPFIGRSKTVLLLVEVNHSCLEIDTPDIGRTPYSNLVNICVMNPFPCFLLIRG